MIEALLHTLWQGILVAALVALALRTLPTTRPATRYLAALSGLLAIVLAWLITWSITTQPITPAPAPGITQHAQITTDPSITPTLPSRSRVSAPESHPSKVFSIDWRAACQTIWLLGVILMLTRAALLLQGAARLRARCSPLTKGPIFDLFHSLNPPPRVAILAGNIPGPCALGLITPALLLPVSMLTDIAIADWRMILAHELAHIRRRDFLVNTLQLIIEALLFFNPAVWWLTRQIRIEREACCDAIAAHEPRAYAALLATLAQTNMPAAALAAANSDKFRGSLLDRVQRLLLPRHQPALRLPLFTFALLTALTFAALFGLQRTTDMAVSHFLTEKQIQQIAEVRRDHGLAVVDPEAEENRVTLTGIVRTKDGEPLPKKLHVSGRCRYRYPMGGGTASFQIYVQPDGSFTYRPHQFGTYTFETRPEGYAASFAGPYETTPGGTINNVEIILKRGFTARVRLRDHDGQTIKQASVKAYYQPPVGKAGWVHGADVVPTDDGLFAVHHAPVQAMEFAVRAEGHQFQRTRVKLSPDAVTDIHLQKAQPTTGSVIDESGKSIADAFIRIVSRTGYGPTYVSDFDNMELLARTDTSGRFNITTLRDNCRYELFAIADGHHGAFIRNVTAGDKDLTATLGPAITVSGKVIGINTDGDKQPHISYRNPVSINGSNYAHHRNIPLIVESHVGTFTIKNLTPGSLTLFYGNHRPRFDITASRDDIVIDARVDAEGKPVSPEFTTRPVVLRFALDKGAPLPRGKLRVDTLPPGSPSYVPSWHDVTSASVRIEDVPAPGKLNYKSSQLIGYWLPRQQDDIEIPEGEGAFEIEMPVEPAGAAYGVITDHHGIPLDDYLVSLVVVERPPQKSIAHDHHVDRTGEGRYFITPLPLDGTNVLVAHTGGTYVLSKPFSPTQQNPSHEINLQLPRGKPLTGKVFLPNGEPAAGVGVSVHYSTPWGHGFGGSGIYTRRDGSFTLQNVNPDVPGEYRLEFEPQIQHRVAHVTINDVDDPVIVHLESGRVIEGVVVDDVTGEPVEGVKVYAIASGWRDVTHYHKSDEKTDTNGKFRISRLGAGKYEVNVSGMRAVTHPIAHGGQSEKVEIRVERK